MNNKIYVAGWACDLDLHGNIWISHFGINGLFKYNIDADALGYTDRFDGVPTNKMLIHGNLYCANDKVFFSNVLDGKAFIYDIVEEKMTTIDVPHRDGKQTNVVFRCGHEIYVRLADDSIYRINPTSLVLICCDQISDIARNYANKLDLNPIKESVYSNGNYGIFQHDDVMCFIYRDQLRRVNTKTLEYEDITLPDKAAFQLFFNGNEIWYTHHFDTDVVYYDISSGKYVTYNGDEVKYRQKIQESDRIRPYSNLFFFDDEVIIPGYRAEGFYKIDKETNTIRKWDVIDDRLELNDWNENDLNPHYYRLFRYKDEILFVPNTSKTLIRYNVNTGQIVYRDFSVNMDDDDKWNKFLMEAYTDGIVKESESIYSLDNYLKTVKAM